MKKRNLVISSVFGNKLDKGRQHFIATYMKHPN